MVYYTGYSIIWYMHKLSVYTHAMRCVPEPACCGLTSPYRPDLACDCMVEMITNQIWGLSKQIKGYMLISFLVHYELCIMVVSSVHARNSL